jgi:hypothetical protein
MDFSCKAIFVFLSFNFQGFNPILSSKAIWDIASNGRITADSVKIFVIIIKNSKILHHEY